MVISNLYSSSNIMQWSNEAENNLVYMCIQLLVLLWPDEGPSFGPKLVAVY